MTKKILIAVLLLFTGLVTNAQILATSNGYSLTQTDFNKILNFMQFLCATPFTPQEVQILQQAEIQAFSINPQQELEALNNLDMKMQQIYTLTDPVQIGQARSVLVANFYAAFQQSTETSGFRTLFEKYNVVLALDPYNQLALTQRDIDAYFSFLTFYANLTGQIFNPDPATKAAYTQQLVNSFIYGDLQTKLSLLMMDPYNKYVQASYYSMTPAQQQQFAASLTQDYNSYSNSYSQNGDYGNYTNSYDNTNNNVDFQNNDYATKQMYFNVMQDMMMQQHATSLNIIENIGNTGNYWEVVDY